jgi:hypothetical protein
MLREVSELVSRAGGRTHDKVPGGGAESPGADRLVNGRLPENATATPTGSCRPN